HSFRVGMLALVCAASFATAAFARSRYDGSWSVVIITRSGACDPSYRSGVQISNGYVYSQAGGVNFQGHVARNGTVRVSVSAGGQFARGTGRLSQNGGGGVWRGQGNGGACAGIWQAERRG